MYTLLYNAVSDLYLGVNVLGEDKDATLLYSFYCVFLPAPGLLPDHRPRLPEGHVPKPKPHAPLNRYARSIRRPKDCNGLFFNEFSEQQIFKQIVLIALPSPFPLHVTQPKLEPFNKRIPVFLTWPLHKKLTFTQAALIILTS